MSGNGGFGFWWGLSEESISRQLSHHLPTYGEKDVFVLAGLEDLVPLHGGTVLMTERASGKEFKVKKFKARIEAEPLRVEQWTSSADENNVFWKTISADNVTRIFGNSANSRIFDDSIGQARIFSWLISDCYDGSGNAIQYCIKKRMGRGCLSRNYPQVPQKQISEIDQIWKSKAESRS